MEPSSESANCLVRRARPTKGDGLRAHGSTLYGFTAPRARIGANAVIVKDVPNGATAVGVPARIARVYGKMPDSLADPDTGARAEPNLEGASQMIEILSLLDQKTKGNLSAEERQVLEQVLFELRLRYVQAQKDEQDRPRIIHP